MVPSQRCDIAKLTPRVSAAIAQVRSALQAQAPFLSREVFAWIRQISPDGDAPAHFTHVRMFPILQLPEWLLDTLPSTPDLEFQQSLIHSSVNGYYCIRLSDDVMDDDHNRRLELSILPAAGFFCSQFQFFYQRYFPPQHAFWHKFNELWIASCESSARDASLRTVGWSDFERVAARKYSAACIPVAAVCYYYDCLELMAPWLEFTNTLARWSQMLDDILDWYSDRRGLRATYFLSEGERQKRTGESLDQWVVREGCAWGFDMLEQWMKNLRASAGELGSAGLQEYLGRRKACLQQQKSAVLEGFRALSRLATILQQAPSASGLGLPEERNVLVKVGATLG